MLTSVVGINRGDEGKGRMVDLLAEKSDIVCLITFVLNIWTNLTIEGVYKAEPYDIDEPVKWLRLYGDILKSFVCDICEYLYDANDAGKSIMFEA